MSAPGSRQWWGETALIAAAGFALAALLWDGVPEALLDLPPYQASTPAAERRPEPRTLADLMAAGCVTGEHLQAMREGRQVRIWCPEPDQDPVLLRDLPPEERPFP